MTWLTIISCGILTFLARYSMLGMLRFQQLPIWVGKALGFVSTAVLAAIIAPEVLLIEGDLALAGNPRLLPAIIAGIIAIITRNIPATIIAGMATLWLTGGNFAS